MKRLPLLLAFAGACFAQWSNPPATSYSTINTFLSSLMSAQSGSGSSVPGTCTTGRDLYIVTSSGGGHAVGDVGHCTATNTWTFVSAIAGAAAALHTASFSASPTFACSSSTTGTVDSFELSTALSTNITSSTLSGCSSGQLLNFMIRQATSPSGPFTVVWPTGFSQACQVSPVSATRTKASFWWDGSTAQLVTCSVDSGPAVIVTQAAPTISPSSGSIFNWADSTNQGLWSKDSSANLYRDVTPLASATSHQWVQFIGNSGVQNLTQPAFTDISGTLGLSQGGTAGTTQQAALNNVAPTPTRAGDLIYWNGSNWVNVAGNNSGTQFLQETSSGVPSWATPSGSGTVTHTVGALCSTCIVTGNGGGDVQTPSTTTTLTSGGNISTQGGITTGVGGSVAGYLGLTEGSATAAGTNEILIYAPTSVTPYARVLAGTPASGLVREANSSSIETESVSELSGDCTTSGSNAVTCTQINGSNLTVNSSGVPTRVAGIATAGEGVPVIGWVSNVTGQSTSQSTVTLATSPTSGAYRLVYYADLNTPCTTGSNSVSFTFNWTDGSNARSLSTGSLTLANSQSAANYMSGTPLIWVGSGNVTYTSTVSGTCATGTSTYDIHASLERLQ